MPAPRRSIVAQPLDELAYVSAPAGWGPDLAAMDAGPYAMVLDNFVPKQGRITSRNAIQSSSGNWDSSYINLVNNLGLTPGAPFSIRGGFVVTAGTKPTALLSYVPATTATLTTDEGLWLAVNGTILTSTYPKYAQLGYANSNWSSTPGSLSAPADPVHSSSYLVPGKSYTTLFGQTWVVTMPVSTFANAYVRGGRPHGVNRLAYNYNAGQLTAVYGAGTDIPTGVTAVKAYQSRLWALGGIQGTDSGASNGSEWYSYSACALFYTVPVSPGATNALAPSVNGNWTDPISGLKNVIYVEPDENDPGMGLASFNNRLIIFRRHSIYVLTGQTNANYTVSLLSRNYGCVDQESIVETDHGVYFVDDTGLCITTGTSVVNVSGVARESLSSAVGLYAQTGGGDITAAQLNDDSILIVIRRNSGTNCPTTIWSGIFQPDTGVWWRITSLLFAGGDSNPDQGGTNFSSDALPGRVFGGKNRGSPQTSVVGSRRVTDIEPCYTQQTGTAIVSSVVDDMNSNRTTMMDFGNNIGENVLGLTANYVLCPNPGYYPVLGWTTAASQVITTAGAVASAVSSGGPGVILYAGYMSLVTNSGGVGQGVETALGVLPAGTWKVNWYSYSPVAYTAVVGPHSASPAAQTSSIAVDSAWTNHSMTITADGVTSYYLGFRTNASVSNTLKFAKICVNSSGTYTDGDTYLYAWAAAPGDSITASISIPALSGPQSMPLRWWSGFVPLSGAARFSSIGVRWWVDYLYTLVPNTTANTVPFLLIDNLGNIISTAQLPGFNPNVISRGALPSYLASFGDPPGWVRDKQNSGWPLVQRTTQDFAGGTAEVQHMQVLLDWSMGLALNDTSLYYLCDFYGVGIEYQQGPNLRQT